MDDVTKTQEHVTLSKRIWGLDWSAELPVDLDDEGGLSLHAGSMAEAEPFIREHYPSIFGTEGSARFFDEPATEAKARFFAEMDFLLVRAGAGPIVGIAIAHPTDWSTYYFRSLAILPDHRGRRTLQNIHTPIVAALRRVGVARMEMETSPGNLPMMNVMSLMGWVVVGTTVSERWGALVRLVHFNEENVASAFHRQYSALAVRGHRSRLDSGR